MCGRFVLDRKTTDLVALFEVDLEGDSLPGPSWNIAPTDSVSIVLDSLPRVSEADPHPQPVRRLESARWGLVPGWTKDPGAGAPLINARVEGLAEKASFRTALSTRRAVIPATGYYEWKVIDGEKVPHYVSLPGEELLVFAALYEWWKNPAVADNAPNRWMLSTTILTRPAEGPLAGIHERMPVFLDADVVEEWLDTEEEGSQELVDLIADAAVEVAERAEFHEVDRSVGSVRNNGEHLIARVA